jgi:hypothetical protein
LGNGDGTFQPTVMCATSGESDYVFAADLNGDGALDLVVPNQYSPAVSILLGNGDGTFGSYVNYRVGSEAWRGGVADVNGDGKLDVIVTPWIASDQFYVLPGNGDGTFQKARAYAAGGYPLGITFGDFNRDGILDLAIANQATTEFSVMLGTVVELQPGTLDFGTVNVGQKVSFTTQLTNIRKSALEITSITISGGQGAFSQTNDCGNNVGAGQSCTITVTFTPPTAGKFVGAVVVKDKAPGSPQLVFLSGRGSSAGLSTRK